MWRELLVLASPRVGVEFRSFDQPRLGEFLSRVMDLSDGRDGFDPRLGCAAFGFVPRIDFPPRFKAFGILAAQAVYWFGLDRFGLV